jgi:hypothetical protein
MTSFVGLGGQQGYMKRFYVFDRDTKSFAIVLYIEQEHLIMILRLATTLLIALSMAVSHSKQERAGQPCLVLGFPMEGAWLCRSGQLGFTALTSPPHLPTALLTCDCQLTCPFSHTIKPAKVSQSIASCKTPGKATVCVLTATCGTSHQLKRSQLSRLHLKADAFSISLAPIFMSGPPHGFQSLPLAGILAGWN